MTNFRLIPGIILIVLGVSFLFDINIWRFFWPLVLIFVGFRILGYKESEQSTRGKVKKETSSSDKIDEEIIFGGIDKKIESKDFKGGKVSIVFGGGEIDLRGAKIEKGATVELEVTSVFGGVKVIAPKEWVVSSAVVGVFGGFTNNTVMPEKSEGRLMIKGAAVFGGGEVANR